MTGVQELCSPIGAAFSADFVPPASLISLLLKEEANLNERVRPHSPKNQREELLAPLQAAYLIFDVAEVL
eukprot:Cvel_17352.t1-p1 / transcript=Cvel_17352.t1 / gene=Cvel_17352 / organism=Chromera_velia_CCMP2878 / gene_product=hypothetical protein / transcript_product=hypothetical protein / location=Cvel_scaffold1379:443-649(-) / protein_length=69 / sequence_SO=supercontig / SO=protein_coding / is_pseudo=false